MSDEDEYVAAVLAEAPELSPAAMAELRLILAPRLKEAAPARTTEAASPNPKEITNA